MPLYEYQCEACGNRFERIRKFSDPPLEEPCPTCGGPIRKLISSPAIQFKGKGWYVTDYAKSGSSDSSKSESGSDSTGDSKKDKAADATVSKVETPSASKTESKAASKTETKPASSPAPAKADKS